MAGNSVTMYPGQICTWTPTVTGSDSAAVSPNDYDVSFTLDDDSVVRVVVNPVTASNGARTALITALKHGTASLTWTVTPKGKHASSAIALDADTITVNAARTVSTATGAYSTPTF